MLPSKSSLLGLPVSSSETADATISVISDRLAGRKACIISFINPHAFHLRLNDQAYANALWHFDLVLADGIGVVKALQWINGIRVERQSFDATSLFHPVLSRLEAVNGSLCLVGGANDVAERAMDKMRHVYPRVEYRGALDGYRPFSEIISWVKSRKPDVLLVGMGAPVQESVLLRLKQDGFSGVGITCGGFLDQYAAADQYYPDIVNKLDLRWLYRLLSEPRRLGRRYVIQYQTFIFDVLGAVIQGSFLGRRGIDSHFWLARRYARAGA